MKLVGFIREYNKTKEAISLAEFLDGNYNLKFDVERMVEYLNSGKIVLAWMGYFIDIQTHNPISPDAYFTDGTWIWPGYLPYYLSKFPNCKLDPEFISFVASKDYNIVTDDNFEVSRSLFENQLSQLLSE